MHRGILLVGVLATLAALCSCSDKSTPTTAPAEAKYLFSNMAMYGVWIGTMKQERPILQGPDSIMAVFRLKEMEFYTKQGETWTRGRVEGYGLADPGVGFRTLHPEPIGKRLYIGTRSVEPSSAVPDTIAGSWFGFSTGASGGWRVGYAGPPS